MRRISRFAADCLIFFPCDNETEKHPVLLSRVPAAIRLLMQRVMEIWQHWANDLLGVFIIIETPIKEWGSLIA